MSVLNRVGIVLYMFTIYAVAMSIYTAVGADMPGWLFGATLVCITIAPGLMLTGSDK